VQEDQEDEGGTSSEQVSPKPAGLALTGDLKSLLGLSVYSELKFADDWDENSMESSASPLRRSQLYGGSATSVVSLPGGTSNLSNLSVLSTK